MPIEQSGLNAQGPVFREHKDRWLKLSDAVAGSDTVKQRGITYLPKLSEAQSTTQYNRLKAYAIFEASASRATEALVGAATKDKAEVTVPGAMEGFLTDVNLRGNTFDSFLVNATREEIVTRHGGVLIELPSEEDQPESLLDLERSMFRPYWRHYTALEIIDWDVDESAADAPLTYVKLQRKVSIIDTDDLSRTEHIFTMVLDLDDGVYRKRKWVDGNNGLDQVINEYPTDSAGNTLRFIPFVFLSNVEDGVKKSIIEDLVDMDIASYQTSAGLHYSLNLTATPFLTLINATAGDDSEFVIGPDQPLVIHGNGGEDKPSVEWTEINGNATNQYIQELRRINDVKAQLGASIIQVQDNQVESAGALSIKQSDTDAALVSVQEDLEFAFTALLRMTALLAGISGETSVELNRTFYQPMPTEDVQSSEIQAENDNGRTNGSANPSGDA